MQYPFEIEDIEIEIVAGGHRLTAPVEGIAVISEDTLSGDGDWFVEEVMILAMRGRTWECVTIPKGHPLHEQLQSRLRDEHEDIADAWATYIVEARIGNRADEQREAMLSWPN